MAKNTKIILIVVILIALLITLFFIFKSPSTKTKVIENKSSETKTIETPAQEDKLCGWIDKSDIIIKVNVPEGIAKDTSYEAGFYFSPTFFTARLARQACGYRTGFSYAELKNKGAAQVGVRGYTDSRRRQLENEPISIVFDENGKPSIGPNIEVTIKD
ncbi:MAG: hypothetical protein WC349_04760 [Patescibacteria group bacterium]|jgi:hypothetical protein